jgi:hypothetical protein
MPRNNKITNYRHGFKRRSIILPMIEKEHKIDESGVNVNEIQNLAIGGSITTQIRKNLNAAAQSTKKLNKFIKFTI